MGKANFSEVFKRDAVVQITERGYRVAEVSERLGVSQHSLYAWKRQFMRRPEEGSKDAEIRQLKRDLVRVAGGLGFEPRQAESESAVLPLDDPPTSPGGPRGGLAARAVRRGTAPLDQPPRQRKAGSRGGAAPGRARLFPVGSKGSMWLWTIGPPGVVLLAEAARETDRIRTAGLGTAGPGGRGQGTRF